MPHQCVRCNEMYDDGAKELLEGCSKCSGRFFFYIKKKDLKEMKKITVKLTDKEKIQIEKDVFDIIGVEAETKPVILDLESVRVIKPGKFEIDIVNLFSKNRPLIYKLGEGKYIIDIESSLPGKKDDSKGRKIQTKFLDVEEEDENDNEENSNSSEHNKEKEEEEEEQMEIDEEEEDEEDDKEQSK